MITGFLEFFHARKWIAELLLILVIVGSVWWFCNHLIDVGVQKQKDADAAAYAELKEKADKETGRLQGIADAAEHAHYEELTNLRNYRNDNPLHGSLWNQPAAQPRCLREAARVNTVNEGTSTTTATVQQVPESHPTEQPSIDQLGLLDALAGRADQVSSELREYQARF